MFKFLNRTMKKKGQSTVEYAILIIIIIGALLAMQVWLKRSISGRLKSAGDDIGDQFSPGNTNVVKRTVVNSYTEESFVSGESKSTLLENEVTTELTNSIIMNVQQEYWGN